MGEALLSPVFTFGYLCLFLVIASALRSKLSFLQKAFIPSSILAGFLLLLIGPGVLGLINIPEGQLESLVYVLLTILFIVLGLRGFSSPLKGREVAAQTALLTTLLAFLGVLGMAFAFLLVLFRLDLFAGFGSLLMLGYGFDQVLALFFAGFWEKELAFTGGTGIAYSFVVFGFLTAYIFGLVAIFRARKKYKIEAFQEDDPFVLTGLAAPHEKKEPWGTVTTGSQSLGTLAYHAAIIGTILLVTLFVVRLVSYWMISSGSSSMVIIGEVFLNLNFLFGLAAGIAARKLLYRFAAAHTIDRGTLNQILGLLVDLMIVAAVASIPLVISSIHAWAIILLSLLAAFLLLILVPRVTEKIYGSSSLEKELVTFGFLTGNITSSLALLRIVDPELESPDAANIAWAGGLVLITGLPLLYLINIPLVGNSAFYLFLGLLLTALYGAAWYFGWRGFWSRRGFPL